jgi:YcxB-like protein
MITGGPVSLDVQLRAGDLYWIYAMRAITAGWWVRGYLALGLIILVALAPKLLPFLALLILPPIVFLVLAIFLYLLLFRPYLRARAFVRHTHGERDSVRYTFSQDGIDVKSAHSETHFQWAAVVRAKQTAHLFVLYLSKSSSIVVPKRCFASIEQQSSFQGLVKRNIAISRTLSAHK